MYFEFNIVFIVLSSDFNLFNSSTTCFKYSLKSSFLSISTLFIVGFVSTEALKMMIPLKAGNIINISSIWGIHGASCEVAYSTSKGGLITFTKALAKEVGPSGIRVNSVACGFIDTTMNNTYTDSEKRAFVDNHIALCTMGTTNDIANAVSFLASSDAKYITGQTLSVDGGYY